MRSRIELSQFLRIFLPTFDGLLDCEHWSQLDGMADIAAFSFYLFIYYYFYALFVQSRMETEVILSQLGGRSLALSCINCLVKLCFTKVCRQARYGLLQNFVSFFYIMLDYIQLH